MNEAVLSQLPWLRSPPDDFYARCRSLLEGEGARGSQARALASFALDDNRLNALAKTLAALRAIPGALHPLTPFKLAIASNATTHFVVSALVATAARYGMALECVEGGFDQALQESSDPRSGINLARPDAVLIALDHRGLPLRAIPGDPAAAGAAVSAALAHLETVRRGFEANAGATCIVQTLARPVESTFGNLELTVPGTPRSVIDGFNRRLGESVQGSPTLLLDVAAVAESVGLSQWHDPTLWNIGKIPFANAYLPIYAETVCRLIAAMRGKSRRCLVLDLDNTLWGGVIGDDGLPGIVLGQGDPTGEAYLEVQRAALALRDRGVLLAVCSKNDEETARLPFRSHPEMLLREGHIAAFRANWNDKATNLLAIADELSLGIESLVLLDDNPVERGLVREILPEVAVPELPDDPALYARTLLAAGYFEAFAFSSEDSNRAEQYRENAHRAALKSRSGGIEDYLRSLGAVVDFRPFDAPGRKRIAQLINKSNQFNLTTRRYSETDVARMERDPTRLTLQVRLSDSFGDSGMICVVICVPEREDWRVDTWLMSCRVLGRRVEDAVLEEIVRNAKIRRIRRLVGVYVPTERNALVKDHYSRLGFDLIETRDDGTTVWELVVEKYVSTELPVTVTLSAATERSEA